jgi:hypothetical protein
MADDLGIDVEECVADGAGEGEVLLEIAAVVTVVEYPADAAVLLAVRQEEVLVAPGLVLGVPLGIEGVAGLLHRRME